MNNTLLASYGRKAAWHAEEEDDLIPLVWSSNSETSYLSFTECYHALELDPRVNTKEIVHIPSLYSDNE